MPLVSADVGEERLGDEPNERLRGRLGAQLLFLELKSSFLLIIDNPEIICSLVLFP